MPLTKNQLVAFADRPHRVVEVYPDDHPEAAVRGGAFLSRLSPEGQVQCGVLVPAERVGEIEPAAS